MRKVAVLCSSIALSLLAAHHASAQQPGESGTLALGADRLFGFQYSTQTEEQGGVEDSSSTTTISLLGGWNLGPVAAVPRLSLDYFLGPGVSLGGSVMYMTGSASEEVDGQDTGDSSTFNIFVVSPRVGYATMFNDNIGIWPRAGITYGNVSSSHDFREPIDGQTTTSESSTSTTLLSLEAMLILSPAAHVGLTLGPTFDYELARSSELDGEDAMEGVSTSYADIGLQAGLLAWF